MKQADGQGSDPTVPERSELLLGLALIECDQNVPACIESFDDPDRVGIELWSFLNVDCKEFGTLLISDFDQIFKPLGSHQSGRFTRSSQQRIGSPGCTQPNIENRQWSLERNSEHHSDSKHRCFDPRYKLISHRGLSVRKAFDPDATCRATKVAADTLGNGFS